MNNKKEAGLKWPPWETPRRKPMLTSKITSLVSHLPTNIWKIPEISGRFESRYIKLTAFHKENITATVRHGGGGMVGAAFIQDDLL